MVIDGDALVTTSPDADLFGAVPGGRWRPGPGHQDETITTTCIDAGFDEIRLSQIGDDEQGFFDSSTSELASRLDADVRPEKPLTAIDGGR